MKSRYKIDLLGIAILAGIFYLPTTSPSYSQHLTQKDGSKIQIHNINAFSGWLRKGVARAINLNRDFLVSERNCPTRWYAPKEIAWAKKNYRNRIRNRWYGIQEYVGKKCDIVAIFNKEGRLQVDLDYLNKNFGRRYTPLNIFIAPKSGKVDYLKGTLEYEHNKTGKQDVRLFNGDRKLACEGYIEILTNDKGGFYLNCFDKQANIRGFNELRNVVFGQLHSVGSGVTSDGSGFLYVTKFMGTALEDEYPGITSASDRKALLRSVMKSNVKNSR